MPTGTLYTTLSRMKERGWVDDRRTSDEHGPVREVWITAEGEHVLELATRLVRRLAW